MDILAQLNQFKKYGFVYVPVNEETKKPKTQLTAKGDWEWKSVDWQDDDFVQAGAAGIQHEKSNVIAVDFDNPKAIQFASFLAPSFTIQTPKGLQRFYKFGGKTRQFKTLSDRKDAGSVIVEVLHNTQSVFIGKNRKVVNDVPPVEIDEAGYERLLKQVGKIALATMLSENYPASGGRDEYIMKVIGCLVRYSNMDTLEKEQFIEALCIANNDTQELKNRTNKIKRIEEGFKNNERTYGLDALSKEIDKNKSIVGNWFNYVGDVSKTDTTPVTSLSFAEMLQRDYPPTKYLLHPILPDPCLTEIFGHEGSGKTLFTAGIAIAVSQGTDFLKYKNHYKKGDVIKKRPVLVVDGEMPEADLIDRYCQLLAPLQDSGHDVDFNYLNFSTLAEQLNHNFDPLNHELGQTRIELRLEQLEKQFNQKPLMILDNLTYLTELQEKDGFEFISFMKWLIKLRSKGFPIVFIHHATKAGETSSGSNVKERPLDVNVQLKSPEDDEQVSSHKHDTQMIVTIRKMRRYADFDVKQTYIASVSADSGKWLSHKYKKRSKKESIFQSFLDDGHTTWDDSMKGEIGKSTFYRLLNQHNKEEKTNVTETKKDDDCPF